MQYRRLGNSGLKLSAIGLGSWLTYGTATPGGQAVACIRRAYDLGINHFDCANRYGQEPHGAEHILGEALQGRPRRSYVLTTTDPETPLAETLDDLVAQGKVLYYSISEFSPAQTRQAVQTALTGKYAPGLRPVSWA